LHEQRENLFVDAVQDVCLLALRRREGVGTRGAACRYESGLIDAAGRRKALDTAIASLGGEPWMLPVPIGRGSRLRGPSSRTGRAFVLADYGYHARVGKVVPTRERKRLREARGKASLPLVWASDIRPDGTFAFARSRRPGIASWYDAPPNISYATRGPAVLIQRTSNRDQRRRLYAAAVLTSFLDRYQECGFVAENHVIVLEAVGARPAIAPAILAALFNSGPVNERFSAVAGSFSVSAKLLSRFALPDPALVPANVDGEFEEVLRSLFGALESVLAPSEASRDPKHTADQPTDLESCASVDEDTRLKRGAVA
jgi:adenine-specific DNA-methyltransferase